MENDSCTRMQFGENLNMFTCKGCSSRKVTTEEELCDVCSEWCNKEIQKICDSGELKDLMGKKHIYSKRNSKQVTICCHEHRVQLPFVYSKQEEYYGDEPCFYCDFYAVNKESWTQYLNTLDDKVFVKS